jgi:hypothetical protein
MVLWLADGRAEVQVEHFTCTCGKSHHCPSSHLVPGRKKYGIFFLNKNFGIAFELLYEWLADHVRNGVTLGSRFDNYIVKLRRSGGIQGPSPSNLWKCTRFFITHTSSPFIHCPCCGQFPSILCFDATAAWVDVDSIPGFFTTPDGSPPEQRTLGQAIRFPWRKLISSAKARGMLQIQDT